MAKTDNDFKRTKDGTRETGNSQGLAPGERCICFQDQGAAPRAKQHTVAAAVEGQGSILDLSRKIQNCEQQLLNIHYLETHQN